MPKIPKKLTEYGNCPTCGRRIVRTDSGETGRTFYAVKSITMDGDNGDVEAHCSKCKTLLKMPMMKMPRKLRKNESD